MTYVRCTLAEKLQHFGIMQKQLALAAGLAPNVISRLCGSYIVPSVSTALIVCDALEQLTGVEHDVGELWIMAPRRAERPKRSRAGRPRNEVRHAA